MENTCPENMMACRSGGGCIFESYGKQSRSAHCACIPQPCRVAKFNNAYVLDTFPTFFSHFVKEKGDGECNSSSSHANRGSKQSHSRVIMLGVIVMSVAVRCGVKKSGVPLPLPLNPRTQKKGKRDITSHTSTNAHARTHARKTRHSIAFTDHV